MPRKKRPKTFRVVKAVKELARERIGTPRPESVVPDKRKKAEGSEKYKRTLGRWLQEGES